MVYPIFYFAGDVNNLENSQITDDLKKKKMCENESLIKHLLDKGIL